MIIAKSAFEFIEKNPGVMMRDIIAAFPQCNPMSVKNAVHRLYYEGRLASSQTSSGYRYRVAGNPDGNDQIQPEDTSEAMRNLELVARTLESQRYFRRAATVWQQLCDSNCSVKSRERYMRMKNQCVRNAKSGTNSSGISMPAGNYCGGDLCSD
ncbi:TPA: hypothetical protein MAF88_004016 [Klebsiella pneumoniae]|uniref:PerC family transcriptional regulator n=1 Tax=Raoultella ornithinolytica TaxID=54291 RepID=A0ABZ2DUE6_RAOOR|nr:MULTISPECIES: hypothetical protein [Klebsiella/Raoultella group]EKV4533383.1 hypothetical protein [Klebsiella pneumoniae]ELA2799581.1 hypothetical protein [Klebsiella pneumoniae]KAB8157381.1 hypothetical protein FNV36_17035 [Raoultella ornithinolytica]KAB8166602.1 hypothetical protein FNV35_15495 [Raoultella ornithinolytica]MCW9180957.1 hypothetical protein [Klebsiella pneumoniae]